MKSKLDVRTVKNSIFFWTLLDKEAGGEGEEKKKQNWRPFYVYEPILGNR